MIVKEHVFEMAQVSQFAEMYALPAALFVGLYAVGTSLGYMDLASDAWYFLRLVMRLDDTGIQRGAT